MKVFERPHKFVRKELGIDATFIYGDADDGKVILYSNKPLQHYHDIKGLVYVKEMGIDDGIVQSNIHGLLCPGACFYPMKMVIWKPDGRGELIKEIETYDQPSENEIELLGVNGSYAYTHSTDALKRLNPKRFEYFREHYPIQLEIPKDSALVHEGAHIAFYPYEDLVSPEYLDLVSEDIKCPIKRGRALQEAVAILSQLEYLVQFYPELEGKFHDWRSNTHDPVYREAHHMAVEHQGKIDDIINFIRGKNNTHQA